MTATMDAEHGENNQNAIRIGHVSLLVNMTLLAINFVTGIIGNPLVILTIIKTPNLRKLGINRIVVNLSIANFLSLISDYPLVVGILWSSYEQKTFPQTLCSTELFLHTFLSCVELLSIVAISYERYQAVANPFTHNYVPRIWLIISATWIVSCIIGLFQCLALQDSTVAAFCFKHEDKDRLYLYFVVIPFGLLTLSIITFYYVKIILEVKHHSRVVSHRGAHDKEPRDSKSHIFVDQQNGGGGVRNHREDCSSMDGDISTVSEGISNEAVVQRTTRRIAGRKTMEARTALRAAYVVISIVLLWTPLLVFSLFYPTVISKLNLSNSEMAECLMLLSSIARLSRSVNPVVYGLVIKPFRTAFKRLVIVWFRRL
ncbi:Uncharacterised protein r2_g30 [Pycnogonum litorale]